MQEERAASEQQRAAVRAAIQILADTRRSHPPLIVTSRPEVSKSRTIRIGRAEFELGRLALLMLLILVPLYGVMVLAYVSTQSLADREDRVVTLLTTPEVSPVHLVARGGFAADTQATYWGKAGADVAILTLSNLPPDPDGISYHWWAQHGDQRTTLGNGTLEWQDHLRLVATSPDLATPPDSIWVTLEAGDADPSLVEGTVLSWSAH
jgi:hypothetical protein